MKKTKHHPNPYPWMRRKPIVEGWYWWHKDKNTAIPLLIEVFYCQRCPFGPFTGAQGLFTGRSMPQPIHLWAWGGEWAGPIEPPGQRDSEG